MPSAVSKGNTRTSRSKLSSPLVQASTPKPPAENGSWSEPDVNSKPSWNDHGGGAVGVLEDMQPLGQPPSAKVKARVKAEPLRKSLGKSLGPTHDTGFTSEGTSTVDTPRSSLAPEDAVPSVRVPAEDKTTAEYQPRISKRTPDPRVSRGISAAKEPGAASPALVVDTKALHQSATPEPEQSPSDTDLSVTEVERANWQLIVHLACKKAYTLDHNAFGDALKQVWRNSWDDERLTYLMRHVMMGTITEPEKEEFAAAVKSAKRILRRKRRSTESSKSGESSTSQLQLHTPQAQSHAPSQRPELVPHPSIEKPLTTPTARLSMRDRGKRQSASPLSRGSTRASTTDTAEQQDVPRSKPIQTRLKFTSEAPSAMTPASGVQNMPSTETPAAEAHEIDPALQNGHSDDAAASRQSSMVPTMSASVGLHVGVDEQMAGTDDAELETDRAPKRSPMDAGFHDDEDLRKEYTKRRKLDETLYHKSGEIEEHPQSHIRETKVEPRSLRKREQVQHRPVLRVSNGVSSPARPRRGREPSDSPLSDVSATPPPVPNPPTDTSSGRGMRKAKTKQSPEKKHLHDTRDAAGDGEIRSGSDMEIDSDNNDYCLACGGTGLLLCCDGCDRSFHFNCLDPPLDVNSPTLDEPWFCHSCVARRRPPPRSSHTIFAPLLSALNKKNSSVFTLPESISNYFVNIKAGRDGKFEELNNAKTRASRVGVDEPMDLGKIKDGKGQTVLCFHCGKSAAGKRPIIQCDICSNWWHLDCTDPPLANPPCRDQWGRKVRDWMCPLHIDHDLSAVNPLRLSRQRRFHMRRPKNAKIITTALRRGQVNNGLVEILNDSSGSEDDFSDFDELETDNGTVVRLPRSGIKLDFIDKVHHLRTLENEEAYLPAPRATRVNSAYVRAHLQARPVLDRRTALSLVQLATQQKDINITGDALESLIDTMTAEAPKEVIDSIIKDEDVDDSMEGINGLASPPPSNDSEELSASERKQLEVLQEIIKRKLAGSVVGDSA